MFYVSKCSGYDSYVITCSETGKETICSPTQLYKWVREGLKVEGATLMTEDDIGRASISAPLWIEVVQRPEYTSKLAAKTAMLQGVVIKTYKDQIVDISIPQCSGNVTIRLSDFGSRVESRALDYPWNVPDGTRVTLILDDKLWIDTHAFRSFDKKQGCVLDISRCQGTGIVNNVYYCCPVLAIDKSVIDIPERKEFNKGVALITSSSLATAIDADLFFEDADWVATKMVERFKEDFLNAAATDFTEISKRKTMLVKNISAFDSIERVLGYRDYADIKKFFLDCLAGEVSNRVTRRYCILRLYRYVLCFKSNPFIEDCVVSFYNGFVKYAIKSSLLS